MSGIFAKQICLNNACLHMFGLCISQKPLVFFNGYSQQDSLEIICGRSLPRKPTKIYSRILLRNFSWIYFQEILFNVFFYFLELTSDLLVRSFQDFFSDICSRWWWNINKNMSIQNIKIFPRNLQHLFLNNAYFAADIHISGLRIFTKAFGFFLGYFQQDLLGMIYGRSLLRKPTEIYSRIFFKELFVDIFPRNIIQHFLVVFVKDIP